MAEEAAVRSRVAKQVMASKHTMIVSTCAGAADLARTSMGRQPFGLASPAAWLRAAGVDVALRRLSQRAAARRALVARPTLIAFYLPMHTATRLAVPVIDRGARAQSRGAHLRVRAVRAAQRRAGCAALGVTTILGGEFEEDLVAAQRPRRMTASAHGRSRRRSLRRPRIPGTAVLAAAALPRPRPRRAAAARRRYATLQMAEANGGWSATPRRAAAASTCAAIARSCRSTRAVPRSCSADVVLADVRAQVAAGARHITFGDPDFFNGIRPRRGGSSRACRASSPASPTTSRSRSSTC